MTIGPRHLLRDARTVFGMVSRGVPLNMDALQTWVKGHTHSDGPFDLVLENVDIWVLNVLLRKFDIKLHNLRTKFRGLCRLSAFLMRFQQKGNNSLWKRISQNNFNRSIPLYDNSFIFLRDAKSRKISYSNWVWAFQQKPFKLMADWDSS